MVHSIFHLFVKSSRAPQDRAREPSMIQPSELTHDHLTPTSLQNGSAVLSFEGKETGTKIHEAI